MTEPTRYPLAWPPRRQRTKNRTFGRFQADNRPIGVRVAIDRLDQEVHRLGGQYPLLSTNLRVRLDGSPVLNEGMPSDPGVCAYFTLKGEPYALACDTYSDVAQNIAALAAHIEATRRIARYGVATAAETLQAFSALPPPAGHNQAVAPVQRPWRDVFNLRQNFPGDLDAADAELIVRSRYRDQAKTLGSNEAGLKELNLARDMALAEIKAPA